MIDLFVNSYTGKVNWFAVIAAVAAIFFLGMFVARHM